MNLYCLFVLHIVLLRTTSDIEGAVLHCIVEYREVQRPLYDKCSAIYRAGAGVCTADDKCSAILELVMVSALHCSNADVCI